MCLTSPLASLWGTSYQVDFISATGLVEASVPFIDVRDNYTIEPPSRIAAGAMSEITPGARRFCTHLCMCLYVVIRGAPSRASPPADERDCACKRRCRQGRCNLLASTTSHWTCRRAVPS